MGTAAKKRLAFIDHSFHKVTGSADFFQEILRGRYEIAVFFDDAWQGGPEVDTHLINAGDFDVVIFWQVVPEARITLRLACKNILWVPMYDFVCQRTSRFWLAMRGLDLKVICFSKLLYTMTQQHGLNSFHVQYFPEPPKQAVSDGKLRVFLWQRVNDISWPLVKQLLAGNEVEKIVLRDDPDPYHTFIEPNPEDVLRFHIEIIRSLKVAGGTRRADYIQLLSNCNVFIAPRLNEGIGLTFLEAMALGMCVVGARAPTMDEYISHGNTGFLFDPEHASPLDLAAFAECGSNARAWIAKGREQWQASLPAMLQFINEPAPGNRPYRIKALLFLIRSVLLFRNVARRSKVVLAKLPRATRIRQHPPGAGPHT